MALMSSTSLATALPPTCNVLDAQQRSRLIKTTRKLGKMLGTTPVIIADSDASSSVERAPMPERVPRSAASSSLDLSYPGVSNRKGTPLTRSRSLSQASQLSTDSASSSTYPFFTGRDTQSHHGHGCGVYNAGSSSNALLLAHHKQQQAAFAASRPSLNLTERVVSGGGGSGSPLAGASPQQPVLRLPPVFGHAHSASLSIPIRASASSSRCSTAPPSPTCTSFEPSCSASSSSSSDSSAAPQSPVEIEPCSPLFDEPMDIDDARMRKRRMEKLMRHLGECIPSELVFGNNSAGPSRPSSPAPTSGFAKVPMMTQVTHTTVSPSSAVSIPSLNKKRSMHSTSQDSTNSSHQQQTTTRAERRTSVSIVSSSALSLGRVSGMGPFTYRKQFELPAPDVPPLPSPYAQAPAAAGAGVGSASVPGSLRVRTGATIAEEPVSVIPEQEQEPDWNAEAYQDVVKRLRALKR
ncbi:hypothetical protein SCHPADRAFT_577735 [Schizopora paradoxa]|uniref:Uncharacterized protein n=1 Tax=Schizopora paradoxa TaxID=27342 RepID=A0A0H2RWH4_9AGAM|nr:hypothetical protein SCHPADRAFT_577735 [Schizopora paradoxa]